MIINKAVEGKLKRNPVPHFDVQVWNSGGTKLHYSGTARVDLKPVIMTCEADMLLLG
jgi:hypothetical protein